MKNNPEARKKRQDKLRKEISKQYKNGYSYREIANLLNISHEWARRLHLSTGYKGRTLTAVDK